MTTAAALVSRAFREGNLIPIGKAPTSAEQVEGLAVLNSYMLSIFGFEVGSKLREWPVPPHQRVAGPTRTYPLLPGAERSLVPTYPLQVPANSRIIWDGSDQHVYMHPKPADGALVALALGSGASAANVGSITVDGNGRRIDGDDTFVMAEADFVLQRWFYRADLAQWISIRPLALADEMIFPVEFDDLWVCMGMIRLAPSFGKQISTATATRVTEMKTLLQTRYFQTEPTASGGEELAPSWQSFDSTVRPGSWM